ncbi:MAG: hypothetical protein ACE14M_10370 [Terriglobales bacterium]
MYARKSLQSKFTSPTETCHICVQTIFGHIRMQADDKLFDLPQGKMLVLDRAVTQDVEAVEESAFLLTVAYPENAGP